MKNNVFLTIITLLLVAILSLQVVILVKIGKPAEPVEESEEDEVVKVDVSVVQVDTPYGVLKYPSQWIDQMMVVDKKVDGVDTIIFSANLNGKVCDLFTVVFGGEEADGYVGYIKHNGTKISVGIKVATIDETAWTAEEYATLCEMQKSKDQVQKSIFE